MEWWAGLGGQRTSCASEPVDQGQTTTMATTCGAQLEVTSSIFDPWLSADELDLSAILNQTGCVTVTSPPVNELKPNTSQTLSVSDQQVVIQQQQQLNNNNQQHHLHHQQHNNNHHHLQQQHTQMTSATQLRLPVDNKRHIIGIINNNNSTTSQQHQRPNGGAGGSLAGSPLSSSLGSSPLNQHTNYMSSPHSSSSPPVPPSSSTSTLTQQQNIYQNYSSAKLGGSANKVSSVTDEKEVENSLLPEHSMGYFPECFLVENIEQEASVEGQSGQLQHGCAYMLQTSASGRPQLVYQDSIILMPCSDQQQQQQQQQQQPSRSQQQQIRARNNVTSVGGGSSLLSASPTCSTYNQRHTTKPTSKRTIINRPYNNQISSSSTSSTTTTTTTTTTSGSNKYQNQTNASGGQQKAPVHKVRRCRHIIDYVLADEEKRLLIKEGHTDFPMTCQSRPLTKNEERILRKIRRKIRNKKSAQCSRQRKKEYVEELERKYAAVVRENDELRLLLASGEGGGDWGSKFIDQQQQQHN